MSAIFNIELDGIHCHRCGIAFAVPKDWLANRKFDERRFWCPNGHACCYVKDDEAISKQAQDRREHAMRIHLEDQAQAKAENQLREAVSRVVVQSVAQLEPRKREQCPHCEKTFENRHGLKVHVSRLHQKGVADASQR
jgi:uncharacterized C2H2 Zn-finger protein